MPEASLITDDVRALVGRTSEAGTARVTLRALNRTLDIFRGNHDQEFNDGDAVPSFVLSALDFESEGLPMPNLMPDSLLISNEFEFLRPLRLSETLTSQSRLADISERFGGQFGYGIYMRSDVEFRDATGELIARSARTMMQYDASSRSER